MNCCPSASESFCAYINSRWDNAIFDRVIDFKTGRRVVIGQRTHKDDLIGHIKAAGGFDELCIPEEFEPARRSFTPIGWTDWRTQEGEMLRPGQFGAEQVAQAKRRLGSIGYRAKHQQDPQSLEGYLFKADWLRPWVRDPQSPDLIVLLDDRGPYSFNLAAATRFATCDPASSAKTSADFTVVSVWCATPRGDLVWLACYREQVEIPDQPKVLQKVHDAHKPKAIGIEAVASNRSMFQFAQRLGLTAIPMTPKGLDKLSHAQGGLIHAEQAQLWLPGPGVVPAFPLDEVRAELLQFTGTPEDERDDIVDTLSYAVDLKPRFYQPASTTPDPLRYVGGTPPRPGGQSSAPSMGRPQR